MGSFDTIMSWKMEVEEVDYQVYLCNNKSIYLKITVDRSAFFFPPGQINLGMS